MALPYDALFLGSFAYAGYRALGRWLKFSDDSAKHRRDVDFFDSVNELLDKKAAEGERGGARMGQGAAASGQGQLWAEWPRMRPEQRAKLLEEMLKVLRLTGRDARWRHLRGAKGETWAKLTPKQRGELVWAADALDWGFVDEIVEAADAPHAGASIWQITDPLPQLSEEPFKSRAPREDAATLRQAVAAEEAAVGKALRAGQAAAAEELEPVESLTVAEAARRVTVLRELLQGTLGLSTGGRAKRGQELMELLRGIKLDPASAAARQLKEAAEQELADEVEAAIAPRAQEAANEKAAAEARARALATAGVMQARLRGAAGRVGPALTSALLSLGCDEVGGRLGDGSEQLTPGAGSEVLAVSALMAGALAALRGAAGGAGAAAPEEVEEATRLVEALQREVEAALQAKPAAAAQGEGAEAAEAAAPGPPPSLAPLRELAARIAALPAPGGDGAGEEGEGAEGLLAEMRNDIGVRVSESTAALGARADAAVSAMRDRERAARVLRRGQLIIADDASLDAAAAGERPSSPIKRLAYAEAYLKQLGGRSLGGALPDATAFLSGVGGPAGIGGGLDLDPAGAEGAAQLQTLLDEMSLIDDVIKLELGPDTAGALTRITAYLDARDAAAEAEAEAAGGGDAGAEGGPAAAAVVAVTPRLDKEREAANKCREAIAQLAEDPLVQLGLSTAQYRVLAALREAAAAVRGGAADAGAYERGVGALRQVASQLGDIGAAIQVKVAATSDDALRGVLVAQKERAVDLYQRLQAFLSYEDNTRAPALAAVRALKASADAAVAEGSSAAAVQAALAKAEAAEQQVASLYTLLEKLPSPSSGGAAPDAGSSADHAAAVAEATAALNAIGDAAGKLRAELAGYAAYATLRERALATLARASGAAGAPALPEAAGGDKGGIVAPLAELEPELNAPLRSLPEVEEDELAGWEAAGFRAIARGQVAAVLVATGLVPGAAAAAAAGDAPAARATEPAAGLPSGKAPLQLYAERILRLQRLAAAAAHGANAPVARPIQFVIMTSPDTHAQWRSLSV